MLNCRDVEHFFEAAEGCVAIVGVFAFGIGVMDRKAKAAAPPSKGNSSSAS